MPAIPVAQPHALSVPVPSGTQGIFERGDQIYLTTPVEIINPSPQEIEEFAFSKAVKGNAPNENIVWFRGRYVEADRANANGAQWTSQELAIKSLTPMLMPVTIMHDPRTAVGTIADVKHVTPEKDGVARSRIDTVLALWGHRFPEAVREAEMNARAGTLMQSMECYSPWYECSVCHSVFHKLPQGAEQGQWCEHLKESNPSAGYVDLSAAQRTNASRILGDVCFTGTGLIFGTRGAKGAYSEAHLDSWQNEVATFHHVVHAATATATRSDPHMGLVQIEQSELDLLRRERDDARAATTKEKERADAAETKVSDLEPKLEQAEATITTEKKRADDAEAAKVTLEEKANQATLKDARWTALGDQFVAKLGDFTKGRLQEQAGTMSDEEWDNRLKELEETAGVKREAKSDGTTPPEETGGSPTFSLEEIAGAGMGGGNGNPSTLPSRDEQRAVVGSLVSAFSKK